MSERDATILKLYQSGLLIKDIAREVGMAPNSLVGILRRLGVERPAKPQRRWRNAPDLTKEIAELWGLGLCASQIKERLSCSQSVVDNTLTKLKVRTSSPRVRYDSAAGGGSGRSGFAAAMARKT